jgi:oligoribonuclease
VQGPAFAIHHSDKVLDGMNEWCKVHHGASGLTQRVRDSTISMEEAQKQVRV